MGKGIVGWCGLLLAFEASMNVSNRVDLLVMLLGRVENG